MSKCLVSNETCHLRRCDDLIFSGNHAVCAKQLLGSLRSLDYLLIHISEDFRSKAVGDTCVGDFICTFSRSDRQNDGFGIHIALAHVALRGEEHLAHMRGFCPNSAVDNMLSRCNSLVGQAAKLLNERADVCLLGQDLCLHLLEHAGRLIIKRGCLIDRSTRKFKKCKLPLERSHGLQSCLLRHFRIKTVK